MIYLFVKSTLYLILKLFFGLRVKGLENVPENGPFIIASNHVSFLDPLAAGSPIKGKMNYMAKEELFENRAFAWLLHRLNITPLSREATDTRALRTAIKKLKNDEGILLFPEGTRSSDGNLMEAKIGVSVLSYVTDACVVPAYVKGTYEILPVGCAGIKRGKIAVSYGKPMQPPHISKETKKQDYYKFAQGVMSAIKSLRDTI